MKYIVAVSGGVDSVVLLDMLVNEKEHELIVAHFDHGIRDDSAADSRFVAGLAKKYELPFESKREELGKTASEETARTRRYEFLRYVTKKNHGKIVTAHHGDDAVETIAINLHRGTGWRGLAVLNSPDIERPLLGITKKEIYDYALSHNLEWVEDETNASNDYLRNRLRKLLGTLKPQDHAKLRELQRNQLLLANEIDEEATKLVTTSRYFYTSVDHACADEILRSTLMQHGIGLTRPQRERLLLAIRTFKPGQIFEAGSGLRIGFTLREFVVK